jgi:DNA-binding transcriptional MerR regulator
MQRPDTAAELDIAEVARRAGVPASTLRYYEQQGLIAALGRRGLRRQYAPSVLPRLALIALGRSAGFSLAQIGTLLLADAGSGLDRHALLAQADVLGRQIRLLQRTQQRLRHAAACPQPDQRDCRRFGQLLRHARPPARP